MKVFDDPDCSGTRVQNHDEQQVDGDPDLQPTEVSSRGPAPVAGA
jgi:hypothetical protein